MATFVIVPGGCTPSTLFNDFRDFAKSQGVEVVAVKLPSVGRRLGQPGPTNGDDVKAICEVAEPLLDEGKDVIIVTSSLGGVVGTQCLEFLSYPARSSLGKKGSVDKIIYVTSMVLDINTSPMDFFGEKPPRYMINIKEYIHWTDEIDDGTKTFSDLPQEEARNHRKKMDEYHSRHSFENKLTYPGYKHVQVHYVLCELDRVLPKARQLQIIASLETYIGGKVAVHPISAGHLPFVSRPMDTLQLLQEIAQG
ncbi:alpha/beta-hydrolase [Thozetella sp. PMI_491]|nr:alpha/beta-hydrolase [Thozetella sp. PMI_491]